MSRLAVLMSGCGGSSSSTPRQPSVAAPSAVPGSFRCPNPNAEPASVVDHGGLTLPAGATAALLCRSANRSSWAAPRGALTTRLGGLIGVINAQPVHRPDSGVGCSGVGAPAWAIVLHYADGTRTIAGDNGGCGDLLIGGVQHSGSQRVFATFVDSLIAQRLAGGSPDAVRAPPRCSAGADVNSPYPETSPVALPPHLSAAVWCDRSNGGWHATGRLTSAQLTTLRHDVRTAGPREISRRAASDPGRCRLLPRSTSALLVGRDAWGEPVAMFFDCHSYRVFAAGAERAVDIRMLPSTLAVVAGLERRRVALQP